LLTRERKQQARRTSEKSQDKMSRTYCCMHGCAMDGQASDCEECDGLGPHRQVPKGWCGYAVKCLSSDGKHSHFCELPPNHAGNHASPGADAECLAARTANLGPIASIFVTPQN
jgi:hypothetical protein